MPAAVGAAVRTIPGGGAKPNGAVVLELLGSPEDGTTAGAFTLPGTVGALDVVTGVDAATGGADGAFAMFVGVPVSGRMLSGGGDDGRGGIPEARGIIGARGVNPGGGDDGRASGGGSGRRGISTPGFVGESSSSSVGLVTEAR